MGCGVFLSRAPPAGQVASGEAQHKLLRGGDDPWSRFLVRWSSHAHPCPGSGSVSNLLHRFYDYLELMKLKGLVQ